MDYTKEELEIKGEDEAEQMRSREIFEEIRDRAEKCEFVKESEAHFFCQCVKLSILDDGKIEDYECCSNYKFKLLYPVYYLDLLGTGMYLRYEKVKGVSKYEPNAQEIKKDILYLKQIFKEWLKIIQITNHSCKLLQQVSKEARNDIKEYKKRKKRPIFRRDIEQDKRDYLKLVLQSKYNYCIALEIFEDYNNENFTFTLNDEIVEINEFSIIHILNRHYSQTSKPLNSKSFHIIDFKPESLHIQLKEIFNQIESSKLLIGKDNRKIAFNYKGNNYQVWINKYTKQVKGIGNTEYLRLDTFYLINHKDELNKLTENSSLHNISDDLMLHIKKE